MIQSESGAPLAVGVTRTDSGGKKQFRRRDRGLDIPCLHSLEYPRTEGVQAFEPGVIVRGFLRGAWG